MRRILAVLSLFPLALAVCLALTSDTDAASATAGVGVGATISGPDFEPAGSYIEVGVVDGEAYVLSSEPDPWNYLVRFVETPSGMQALSYTREEAESLLWNGDGVRYARIRQAEERARLAAEERTRRQAEAEAGAAGDLPTP